MEPSARVETEVEKSNGQELDVEATLSFAEYRMMAAAETWTEAAPGQKRRLQDALFPEGLVFDGEELGTALTFPVFDEIEGNDRRE